jgi:hypothetical protein
MASPSSRMCRQEMADHRRGSIERAAVIYQPRALSGWQQVAQPKSSGRQTIRRSAVTSRRVV